MGFATVWLRSQIQLNFSGVAFLFIELSGRALTADLLGWIFLVISSPLL